MNPYTENSSLMEQEQRRDEKCRHDQREIAYLFMTTLDALERRDRECSMVHLNALHALVASLGCSATAFQISSAMSTTKDEFPWGVIRGRLIVAWETVLLETSSII